jgi:hypothetical protein
MEEKIEIFADEKRKIHIHKKTSFKIVESACNPMCHWRQRESFSLMSQGDKQTEKLFEGLYYTTSTMTTL